MLFFFKEESKEFSTLSNLCRESSHVITGRFFDAFGSTEKKLILYSTFFLFLTRHFYSL